MTDDLRERVADRLIYFGNLAGMDADEEIDRWTKFIRAELAAVLDKPNDLLGTAWAIIANAGGGDWEKESEEWRGAAARWREEYFDYCAQFVRARAEEERRG